MPATGIQLMLTSLQHGVTFSNTAQNNQEKTKENGMTVTSKALISRYSCALSFLCLPFPH